MKRLKTRLVKFDSQVLHWENEVAEAHETQAEELDNWRDLVREATAETQQAKLALKAREQAHITVGTLECG